MNNSYSTDRKHCIIAAFITISAAALCLSGTSVAASSETAGLDSHTQGGVLGNVGTYQWWYGCSPTAAGMLLGYYDRNGYLGNTYDNLVPGGVAELNTFGNPSALVNSIIASTGHQYDFYSAAVYGYNTGGGVGFGYSILGDDMSTLTHSFDCLADFMGSSQDSVGNFNGATTFNFWDDGSAFHDYDAVSSGVADLDGMYGIGEYVRYAGYDVDMLYNQYVDTLGLTYGFTYSQYMAEIDAGRPVIIQLQNHTVLGYGYHTDVTGADCINIFDTFAPDGQSVGSIAWGGFYQYGDLMLQQIGVTAMTLATVPAPGAILLAGFGAGFVGWLRRRRTL